jgi:hypothetical protein
MLVSVVAMFVVGAFASASASAHTFLTCLSREKGQWEDSLCSKASSSGKWETSEVANATKVEGTSGISKLKGELLSAEILITCKKDIFKGELETGGKSKGEVTFEECSAGNSKETFTACEVPTIKFKFIDELVLEENTETKEKEIADEFKPASGTTFVTIVIKNKEGKSCTEKGEFPTKGTQICLLPQGTLFKVLHNIACEPRGSHLEFNSKAATFESTESVVLSAPLSGVAWAVS